MSASEVCCSSSLNRMHAYHKLLGSFYLHIVSYKIPSIIFWGYYLFDYFFTEENSSEIENQICPQMSEVLCVVCWLSGVRVPLLLTGILYCS